MQRPGPPHSEASGRANNAALSAAQAILQLCRRSSRHARAGPGHPCAPFGSSPEDYLRAFPSARWSRQGEQGVASAVEANPQAGIVRPDVFDRHTRAGPRQIPRAANSSTRARAAVFLELTNPRTRRPSSGSFGSSGLTEAPPHTRSHRPSRGESRECANGQRRFSCLYFLEHARS